MVSQSLSMWGKGLSDLQCVFPRGFLRHACGACDYSHVCAHQHSAVLTGKRIRSTGMLNVTRSRISGQTYHTQPSYQLLMWAVATLKTISCVIRVPDHLRCPRKYDGQCGLIEFDGECNDHPECTWEWIMMLHMCKMAGWMTRSILAIHYKMVGLENSP